ncbi:MAG: phage major capsid protein [Oscillospiraceae bacterium]|nr:phage major capsid protein [Oscillospiraceae bacterium]
MNLEQILTRLAQIKEDIEKRGAELGAADMDALEAEIKELTEKRDALIKDNEKRAQLLGSLSDGGATVVRSFASPTPVQPQGNGMEADGDPYSTMEYRKAFMSHVLKGEPIPAEYRADAITKTTDIGSIIPTEVLNKIVEKIEAVGMILPLVTKTAYKGGLVIPTSTVKPVATWISEGAKSDKQKKSMGDNITFAYHKLRCAVAVTLEVDTMSLSVFETTLINNVVEAMIKKLEESIISGDGSGKPKGILTEAPESGQKINSSKPSYQDLIDAEAALPIEYETGAVWCMTKKTFMAYFGITDATGQPIGRVNYGIAGKPERFLLGRPVVVCNYLDSFAPTLAAGKAFAFLFNFADYVLNANYQMGVKKYEDNDTDDQITRAVMLVDGKVVDKNSLVIIAKKA